MRRVPHKYMWPLTPSFTTHLIWEWGKMIGNSHWSIFLDWMEFIYLNLWVKNPFSFWNSSRQKSSLSESTLQTQTCLQMDRFKVRLVAGSQRSHLARVSSHSLQYVITVMEIIVQSPSMWLSFLSLVGFELRQGTRTFFISKQTPARRNTTPEQGNFISCHWDILYNSNWIGSIFILGIVLVDSPQWDGGKF